MRSTDTKPRVGTFLHRLAAILTVLLLVVSIPVQAQITKDPEPIDPELLALARGEARPAPGPGELRIAPLPVRDDMVLIDAVATGDVDDLRADLVALGLQGAAVYGRVCSGWLPVSSIDDLAKLTNLRFARPSLSTRNVGLTDSQGDAAMNADDVRATYGVDGAGITIGVLSDSYDFLGGASGDVASGDLPGGGNPNGYTTPVDVLADFGFSDEGRGMLQLIHDVAPGADLSFHTAFGGLADFAVGIEELAGCPAGSDPTCGTTTGGAAANPAEVIVDDVIYFAEPMFQDGIIAQAVDVVKEAGVSYFSSAGNSGRQSYDSPYRPSGTTIFGLEAHDFDPGPGVDVYQQVTFTSGSSVPLSFQWDQPFFSVTGGPGATTDLDFCLFSDPPTILYGCFLADNIASGDPVEFGGFSAGFSGTFNIAILKFAGPDPGRIKYVWFRSWLTVDEYDTSSSTVYGHANAAGAEAVGAAFFDETPEFGTDPPLIEGFSSAGGTPILFDVTGAPIGPITRHKPEITAPDGTNTTFFGSDVPEDPDGFPNFFGTSAAAPHAAAVAALLLDAKSGPGSLTPDEIYSTLESTTIDMDDPFTPGFDTGFDLGTGYGLIDAFSAVSSLLQADLALTKTLVGVSGDLARHTVTATFKLSVTNNGPDRANGVVVSDPLPEGATLVSASGAYDAATGVWTIGTLGVGETVTLVLELTADADNNLVNVAEVSALESDPVPGNNMAGSQARHDSPPRFEADLSVTKTVDNATPSVGQTVVYTITVTNHGPHSTAGVVVLDTLAAGLAFGSASFSDPTDSYDPATGRWVADQVKVGQTATMTLEAEVTATGAIVNTAQVWESHLRDPDSAIGQGSETEDDHAGATIDVSTNAQAKATATEGPAEIPKQVALGANYPNPFNPETVIPFAVPERARVRIAIYDVLGREVAVLLDAVQRAGHHTVTWQAGPHPTGVYLIRLEAAGTVQTRHATLMK